MITVNVTVSVPSGTIDRTETFRQRAAKWFQVRAAELVAEKLTERPNDPFQLTVDGRNAASVLEIGRAEKYVRLQFIQDIIELGLERLGRLEDVLKAQYASREYVAGNLRSATPLVSILYYPKTGPMQTIASASQIKNFAPGDRIYLVPDIGMQMYANTKNWHGRPTGKGGFMARASAAIRRSAGLLSKQSVIYVSAVRSLGVYHHMIHSGNGTVQRVRGKPFVPAIQGKNQRAPTGAWAIVIGYRNKAIP